jgi:putative endonuclease
MTTDPRRRGAEGEEEACRHLLELGWTIVKRNFKGRRGEIDVLALDGDDLVAVEVRLRKGDTPPEETVSPEKVSRILSAIEDYVQSAGQTGRAVRVDLIAIDKEALRHHRDILV